MFLADRCACECGVDIDVIMCLYASEEDVYAQAAPLSGVRARVVRGVHGLVGQRAGRHGVPHALARVHALRP